MYELNKDKIRCGGVYCSECKKCICQPRVRKYLREEFFMICDECEKDVLTLDFCPNETALLTHLKIKYKDIKILIKELTRIDREINGWKTFFFLYMVE